MSVLNYYKLQLSFFEQNQCGTYNDFSYGLDKS